MQGGILLLISCQRYQNKREGIWKTINLVQTADLPTYFLSRSTKLSFFQFICEILLSVLNCNKFNFRSTKSLRVVTCGLWRNAILQFSLIEDWLMVTTFGSLLTNSARLHSWSRLKFSSSLVKPSSWNNLRFMTVFQPINRYYDVEITLFSYLQL